MAVAIYWASFIRFVCMFYDYVWVFRYELLINMEKKINKNLIVLGVWKFTLAVQEWIVVGDNKIIKQFLLIVFMSFVKHECVLFFNVLMIFYSLLYHLRIRVTVSLSDDISVRDFLIFYGSELCATSSGNWLIFSSP